MKNIFGGMTGIAEKVLRGRGKQIDKEVEKASYQKQEPKKEQRPSQSKKWIEK